MPDAKTIWLFRERLTQAGAIEMLFNRIDATLREAGYLPMPGQMLDATPVAAPRQRNTNAEKASLREGRIPEGWQDRPLKRGRWFWINDTWFWTPQEGYKHSLSAPSKPPITHKNLWSAHYPLAIRVSVLR